ncbi:MAG: mechanosensitive ion channel family protein [Thiohalomonadales bacterium]
MKSFIDSVNVAFTTFISVGNSYIRSSRYYLTEQEEETLKAQFIRVDYAKRTLNLSELPTALTQKLALDKVLELAEILARIELPDMESIPGIEEMEGFEFKHWTIPGTDITLSRVEKGSRAGEYLFSPETVAQLSEFYARVKNLPYKTESIPGLYEDYHYGAGGLRNIIPYRWLQNLPDWLTYIILDQPVWRWLGIILLLLLTISIVIFTHRLVARWSTNDNTNQLRKHWARLAWPGSLLLLIPYVIQILEENLRISEVLFAPFTLTLWTIFTICFTWIVWSSGNLVSELIVQSKNLISGSIDSQLIRLGFRLISFILAITVVVVGSQRLGIPAYSIITGLGVGGVAIAFAAKDSVANLLGSLVIMFEKPFKVGHWIKAGNSEGVVESVGFRSTRIRTFYNSVLSIPSDTLVNTLVDNMGMRDLRRIRTTFYIKFNTDAQKIENFVTEINAIITENEFTSSDNIQIAFKGFATYGLEILVSFFLTVSDIHAELRERQIIMMAILKLANSMEIEFAKPVTLNEPT